MPKTVQQLLDEAEIKEVLSRYCRGIDRMDWDLIRSCYHHDAIDDHGDYVGDVDGFIEYAKSGLKNFSATVHFMGNQIIEVKGEFARVESYLLATHRMLNPSDGLELDLTAFARTIDRMERRDGEWRIGHRVLIVDSERTDPVAGGWAPATLKRGMRNTSDPCYGQ